MFKKSREVFIKDTHRGLMYKDGRLDQVLEAGRYKFLTRKLFFRVPRTEITLVDVRERDLTIKGQEILTADKVAIRVSILVQFRVVDPKAAIHSVANYEERIYSDVQLAARRALAAMNLEEILTNRNRLSEEILAEVQESASGYGVSIRRADVKDLIFPGNLQEIMNRVLAAERNSEAQLVDARTRAEVQQIEAQTEAEVQTLNAKAEAESQRIASQADLEAKRNSAEAELKVLLDRQEAAKQIPADSALLKLEELQAIRAMAGNAKASIYIGMDRVPQSEE